MHKVPAQTITVPEGHADRRLDKFIRSQVKGVPATLLFRLMRKGAIRLNGKKCKPDHRTATGDEITLPELEVPDKKKKPKASTGFMRQLTDQLKKAIVYEDKELMVINKPAGMAVHVGSGVKAGVIEALRELRPDTPDLELAHRLDRDTSGLMLVAKTSRMLRYLQDMLRNREEELQKYYLAVVGGVMKKYEVLTAPMKRTKKAMIVASDGVPTETRVHPKKTWGRRATLIEAQLITGRKHQIRVQLSHAGHPIVGDSRYGDKQLNRDASAAGVSGLLLHASRLIVPMPDGEQKEFTAPMPPAWTKARKL